MSWPAASKAMGELGLDPSLFPSRDPRCDVWSVAVPIGDTFDGWLSVMNNHLQPDMTSAGWVVQSLSVLLDGSGDIVVVSISRRVSPEQLRPQQILVPQPGPPNLRPVV